MDLSLLSILSLLTLLTSSIIWYLSKSSNPGGKTPPGPRGLPILGYLPFMHANLHTQLTDLGHKYGPIYKFYLGCKLHIVISSPSLVKEVVRDQDGIFGNRDPNVATLVGTYGGSDIAWSPLNLQWRNMRKTFAREMMSNTCLEASRDLRKNEVRKTIKRCYQDQKPIDISRMLFQTELNVMTSMLWGGILEGEREGGYKLAEEFHNLVSKMVSLVGKPNISDFFPFLACLDIQGIKRQAECLLLCLDRILNDVIAAHKGKLARGTMKEGKNDFLQIMLELNKNTHEGSNISLSDDQLKAMLLDILSGGTDTSAITIEWAMAELINDPKAMEKAKHELDEVVGLDNIVEEHHTAKMKYLEAVLKETLRLHPPLPFLVPRCPNETSIIGGYTIPKNTRVFINVPSIHMDPQLWDNPMKFKPERFLDGNEKWDFIGNNFQYFPFGSGRRMCAGLALAERMLIYFLSTLVHSFNWKLPEDGKLDMSEDFGIMLRKSVPLVAIPHARLSDSRLYD